MSAEERRWIGAEFADLSYETLDELEEIFKKARAATDAGTWRNLEIETERDYDIHRPILKGQRLETDGEFLSRTTTEKTLEKARDIKEKAEYERLKAKFGDGK